MRGDAKKGNQKYSDDGPFNDPVVRCDGCAKIVLQDTLRKMGMCPNCGKRRVNKVSVFNEDELNQMIEWGVDPDFFAIFENREEGKDGG